MDDFDFKYNFGQLDLLSLRDRYGITSQEAISVFENFDARVREIRNDDFAFPIFISIGDSLKERIIMIAFTFPEDTVNFIGASPPSQRDIEDYYC